MENVIKIDGEEYDIKHMSDLVGDRIEKGGLIELRKGEFFSTKKHFVNSFLAFSKIFPFPDKMNFYRLAFKAQFTNAYSEWLNSKMLPKNITQ